MGPHAARRRIQAGDPHGQAPRRLLPLAHGHHLPLGGLVALARREGRRAGRAARGVPQVRHALRRLPLALGPQRPLLRRLAALQRPVRRPAHRTADPLRQGRRGVVRRRLRRRPQRPQARVRLGAHLRHHRAPAARGRHGHHGSGRALGRQRGGPGPHHRVERHSAGARRLGRFGSLQRAAGAHGHDAGPGRPRHPLARHGRLLVALGGRRLDPPGVVLPPERGRAGEEPPPSGRHLL